MRKNLLTLLFINALILSMGGVNLSAQVAKVGNTLYQTIDDAIANWTSGTTLTLLADVTLTDVITLKSTEHHILNLSSYTMTAASGKNAIEITPIGVGTASRSCLTINADAINPGGITASKKYCIYYNNSNSGLADRACITINGGVFNGSYAIYSNSAAKGQSSPHYVFNGGIFNASITLTQAMLDIKGGTFNKPVGCTGISTSRRLIQGGTFESFGFMTSGYDKFTIGKANNTYNVGVYVNDDDYLVVGGNVITNYKDNSQGIAFSAWSSKLGWNSNMLKYSSAAANGLYYTSIKHALNDNTSSGNTVHVYSGTADITDVVDASSKYKNTTIVLAADDSEFTVIFNNSKTLTFKAVTSNFTGREITYTDAKNGNITTRVYRYTDVAKNEDLNKYYMSLQTAVVEASDGHTVTLLYNTETTNSIDVDKDLTLNFEGKKYNINNSNTYGFSIPEGKTVTIKGEGGNLTSNSTDVIIKTSGTLTLKDVNIDGKVEYLGGELFSNVAVDCTVKKDFEGIGDVQGQTGWSTISTPIANATIPNATAGVHDLYRYDEVEQQWEYFKDGVGEGGASNPFTKLELGRGYLYTNKEDITIELNGTLNINDVTFPLSYTEGNVLAGFNLIGNPFTYNISHSNFTTDADLSQGFYTMSNTGAWVAKTKGTNIAPMESVLVKTDKKASLRIGKTTIRSRENNNGFIAINASNDTYGDVAYISFNEGLGLDKISHRNEDVPMLYIPVDGTDYAIAALDENITEVPVWFDASKFGEYTISVMAEDCEYNTLTLVDRLTGAETNMLIDDYSFIARASDKSDRFILKLSKTNDVKEDDNFTYVNNGHLMFDNIEGEASVRIYDVMGRHIAEYNVSGTASIPMYDYANGMYIVQMTDNNGIKVQKVVID